MRRTGLRLRAARGHPEVQAVVRPFVRWLRERYEFPVRVPVYLSPAPQVRTVHGDWCSASFFAPWDRRVEHCQSEGTISKTADSTGATVGYEAQTLADGRFPRINLITFSFANEAPCAHSRSIRPRRAQLLRDALSARVGKE